MFDFLRDGEYYKEIKDFEGLYYVTTHGRIISTVGRKVKVLKYGKDSHGYYQVGLSKNAKSYTRSVHRLVGLAFIPNPTNLPYINHIDGNPKNPNVSNLEWCTPKYNCHHAIEMGSSIRGKMQHGKKGNTSGFVGVSWDKWYQKWSAQIGAYGVRHKLGFFENKEDAAHAYDKASLRLHGNTGRRNFE